MSKMVRLKPYNPRAGQLLRRYTYRGIKIEEGKGWYKVPDDVAEYLSKVRSIEHDELAPFAFDVATKEEAEKITEKEYRDKVSQGRLSPGDAPTVTPRETNDQDRGRAKEVDWPEDMNPATVPSSAPVDMTTADLTRGTSRGAAAASTAARKPPKARSTRGG